MGKLKIESLDRRIKLRKLAKAVYKELKQVSYFKVELVFQDGESMQYLNQSTRGVDSVTDVLSYPSMEGIKGKILKPIECRTELEGKYIFMGSIVLCDDKIRAQAEEFGHSEQREREYLIIHGLLHLFGYDHMTDEDKKEMRAKEKAIIAVLYPEEAEQPTEDNDQQDNADKQEDNE